MLLEAATSWNIDLHHSFMIGDRWRDTGAGKAAGCRTFFIDRGYSEQYPEDADHIVADLPRAVTMILAESVGSTQVIG